ncbi:hypothetical protein HU230_0006305 [Bradyrhizobium quebecense]|uniref:Uncharacterized protein n=1 Tax=Bradyrhizobium quebecense TaxID=2748629 RepID=A0A973WVH3_9BRAD|nr:hypothetical protein [Bradyrhizobium quebecense]UGA45648.1 hypothetical protein HU230_0006305 [Bradyrhizobium quebecense]
MAVERRMMPISEFEKLDSVCAWRGCRETCRVGQEGQDYLPKGWTFLLMFWAREVPLTNLWDAVPQSDMLRDAVLCPQHTRELDRLLIPLPRHNVM